MKTKHVSMKAIALIFATALAVAVTPASANEGLKENPSNAKVIYLGNFDDEPTFRVVFENATGEEYLISLKDENGITMYSERTRATLYNKKYIIQNSDYDPGEITITITARKSGITQTFLVKKEVSTVEEIVVTEVVKH
jgi:hypothetical protein